MLDFSGGVAHLLKALASSDKKLVEASVRSLKMIFQVSGMHHAIILHTFHGRVLVHAVIYLAKGRDLRPSGL